MASSRAVVLAIGLALMPEACAKMFAKKPPPADPDPVPTAVTTTPATGATTPPIWHPPDTATTAVDGAAPGPSSTAPSADLLKARAAAEAKDFKKVKTLLEKKVRSGKGTPEENLLVFRACVALKDKACADAVKAKHPEDIAE